LTSILSCCNLLRNSCVDLIDWYKHNEKIKFFSHSVLLADVETIVWHGLSSFQLSLLENPSGIFFHNQHHVLLRSTHQ